MLAKGQERWPVLRNGFVPLHKQIEEDLRERIQRGYWKPGELIESESELCALYDASRTTVRQAMRTLVDEGLVVRERGKGTFVRDPAITAGARGLTSFTEEMEGTGRSTSATVLEQRKAPAPYEVARRLRLPDIDDVVIIRRLRYADAEPIGLQTAYLPAFRFPGLERAALEGSLYGLLRKQYGVSPIDAEELLSVVPAGRDEAEALSIKPGTPGLHVERVTFDGTTAFEYVVSFMRGDRYKVKLALHRQKGEI